MRSKSNKPRKIFVNIRTRFFFQRSTKTPATQPKIIAGIVKESTAPDTAVFECVCLKTMRIKKKLKILSEICVNTSPIQRLKNDLSDNARRILVFMIELFQHSYQFEYQLVLIHPY